MAQQVPHLALSHGQVLWCLAGGREPTSPLPDQVRYLRQLGIPFNESELGRGRGVRLAYSFYHLIELGVAVEALRLRVPPRFLTDLVEDRTRYRDFYRAAYQELTAHPKLFEAPRRSRSILADELYLRFHDRYSDTPGRIAPIATGDSAVGRKFGDWVEYDEEGTAGDVIPLKSLMLWLLRWAEVAPPTAPGPKS